MLRDEILAFMQTGTTYNTREIIEGVGRLPRDPSVLCTLQKLASQGHVRSGDRGDNGYQGYQWEKLR
jgi:hypothetical protein